MSDVNRVVLIGRLVRDPELKSTNTGTYFCKFTLASNRTISQKEGEKKDEVGFFDCIAWGKLAEVISKYTQKGKRVSVDGSLRFSSWEHEGRKQSKVEIYVENLQFLESSRSAGDNHVESSPTRKVDEAPFNDDIPF